MLSEYRKIAKKKWFDYQVRKILNTPPAGGSSNSNFSIVSQLHPPDLLMYLLAVKSFTRFVTPRSYYIVDDGLAENDHKILRKHLANVEFIPIDSVELGSCPKGGCWERLASIAKLCQDSFVVQLDADTLTLMRPDEVLQSINDNRSFTLGTSIGRKIIDAREAAAYAATKESRHIQLLAEKALLEYPNSDQLYYVRGCAGFAGFAPGTVDLGSLSNFSEKFSDLVGDKRWSEWGSEQFTSNFFIANSKSAHVLPFDNYPYNYDKIDMKSSKLIHFVGSHRFSNGMYARMGRKVIYELTNCFDPSFSN